MDGGEEEGASGSCDLLLVHCTGALCTPITHISPRTPHKKGEVVKVLSQGLSRDTCSGYMCWLMVWCVALQATLFLGQLNSIAPIVTMFFLVSYCVVNLACFALKLAAAPNFR